MANNLLIGVIDTEQEVEDQLSDYSSFRINKIGGYPVLSPESKSGIVCHLNSLVCDLCQKQLTFISQIYCPVDETLIDRVIYLYVCINSECNQNKWYAFRSVTPLIQTPSTSPQESSDNKNDMWIEGQDDWGTDETESEAVVTDEINVCADLISKLDVQTSGETTTNCVTLIANKSAQFYRPLYVNVIDEPIGGDIDDKHVNQLIHSYETTDGKIVSDTSATKGNEMFEQNFLDTIYKSDRQNYKFFKRLSICPKQVIRYQLMGSPLVNSDSHKLIVPKCESCGADRCFELQLMPALISYLRPLVPTKLCVDLDFASILVYTCGAN
ncbi:unnamed protein product [Medioppia subpectinata]|uniref:Programmed cell death protein 2 C-terminal domain-containing protein n=1 Tax=Medioppia subpectinata TaxID=1979941 RepID=A0A7R9PZF4_9ACAR|nr:unnamed protein product [Medioppia subpectinata]CAG2106875.1 unnamed protein product [Medioppia subpectinata]